MDSTLFEQPKSFFFWKNSKINWYDFWRHNLFWMQINGIAYVIIDQVKMKKILEAKFKFRLSVFLMFAYI